MPPRWLRLTLLLAVLLYATWAWLLYGGQRQMLYPGAWMTRDTPPPPPPADAVVLQLPTSAGRVEAWYLPPRVAGARVPALLLFHGNNETVDRWLEETSTLRARGIAVLLTEYPGYGRSEGKPELANIMETARAAYDALVARPEVDPARIIVMGHSLGGGPASALTRERPVAALVLLSTYTRITEFAASYLLPAFLVEERWDNLSAVQAYAGPVFIAHAPADPVVPFAHAEALARAARRGRLVPLACTHGDCPPDWPAFEGELVRWLAEAGVAVGTQPLHDARR
ncbi:MAG: alpha/beta fold hydrolase [Gemmatimonadales bacterium]|nr:alpha/beta fold hydrolase [Gemmatimonadales bacterium]